MVWAAKQMPPNLRARFEEEWLGILSETPGKIAGLFFSFGCCIAALKIPKTGAVLELNDYEDDDWLNVSSVILAFKVAGSIPVEEFLDMSIDEQFDHMSDRLYSNDISDEDRKLLYKSHFQFHKYLKRVGSDNRLNITETPNIDENGEYIFTNDERTSLVALIAAILDTIANTYNYGDIPK